MKADTSSNYTKSFNKLSRKSVWPAVCLMLVSVAAIVALVFGFGSDIAHSVKDIRQYLDTDEEICVTDNNNNIIAVSGKEYPDLANEMKNPELIEYFLSFKDILKSYGEADNEKKKPVAGDEFIDMLSELVNAVNNYNIDGMDRAMSKINKVKVPVQCVEIVNHLRAWDVLY